MCVVSSCRLDPSASVLALIFIAGLLGCFIKHVTRICVGCQTARMDHAKKPKTPLRILRFKPLRIGPSGIRPPSGPSCSCRSKSSIRFSRRQSFLFCSFVHLRVLMLNLDIHTIQICHHSLVQCCGSPIFPGKSKASTLSSSMLCGNEMIVWSKLPFHSGKLNRMHWKAFRTRSKTIYIYMLYTSTQYTL